MRSETETLDFVRDWVEIEIESERARGLKHMRFRFRIRNQPCSLGCARAPPNPPSDAERDPRRQAARAQPGPKANHVRTGRKKKAAEAEFRRGAGRMSDGRYNTELVMSYFCSVGPAAMQPGEQCPAGRRRECGTDRQSAVRSAGDNRPSTFVGDGSRSLPLSCSTRQSGVPHLTPPATELAAS